MRHRGHISEHASTLFASLGSGTPSSRDEGVKSEVLRAHSSEQSSLRSASKPADVSTGPEDNQHVFWRMRSSEATASRTASAVVSDHAASKSAEVILKLQDSAKKSKLIPWPEAQKMESVISVEELSEAKQRRKIGRQAAISAGGIMYTPIINSAPRKKLDPDQVPEQVKVAIKELGKETERVRNALKRYDIMSGTAAKGETETKEPEPQLSGDLENEMVKKERERAAMAELRRWEVLCNLDLARPSPRMMQTLDRLPGELQTWAQQATCNLEFKTEFFADITEKFCDVEEETERARGRMEAAMALKDASNEFRVQSLHRVQLAKALRLRELKCDIAVRVLETKKCSLRAAEVRKEEAVEVLEAAFSGPDGACVDVDAKILSKAMQDMGVPVSTLEMHRLMNEAKAEGTPVTLRGLVARMEVKVPDDILEQLPMQGNRRWRPKRASVIDAGEESRIKARRLELLKRRAQRLILSGHPVQALKDVREGRDLEPADIELKALEAKALRMQSESGLSAKDSPMQTLTETLMRKYKKEINLREVPKADAAKAADVKTKEAEVGDTEQDEMASADKLAAEQRRLLMGPFTKGLDDAIDTMLIGGKKGRRSKPGKAEKATKERKAAQAEPEPAPLMMSRMQSREGGGDRAMSLADGMQLAPRAARDLARGENAMPQPQQQLQATQPSRQQLAKAQAEEQTGPTLTVDMLGKHIQSLEASRRNAKKPRKPRKFRPIGQDSSGMPLAGGRRRSVVAEILRHRVFNDLDDLDNVAVPPGRQHTPRSMHTLHEDWMSPRGLEDRPASRPVDEVQDPGVMSIPMEKFQEAIKGIVGRTENKHLRKKLYASYLDCLELVAQLQSLEVVTSPPPPCPPDWIQLQRELETVVVVRDDWDEKKERGIVHARMLLIQCAHLMRHTLKVALHSSPSAESIRQSMVVGKAPGESAGVSRIGSQSRPTTTKPDSEEAEEGEEGDDGSDVEESADKAEGGADGGAMQGLTEIGTDLRKLSEARMRVFKDMETLIKLLQGASRTGLWLLLVDGVMHRKAIRESQAAFLLAESKEARAARCVQRLARKWLRKRHRAALAIQRVHRGIADRSVVHRLKRVRTIEEQLIVYEQRFGVGHHEMLLAREKERRLREGLPTTHKEAELIQELHKLHSLDPHAKWSDSEKSTGVPPTPEVGTQRESVEEEKEDEARFDPFRTLSMDGVGPRAAQRLQRELDQEEMLAKMKNSVSPTAVYASGQAVRDRLFGQFYDVEEDEQRWDRAGLTPVPETPPEAVPETDGDSEEEEEQSEEEGKEGGAEGGEGGESPGGGVGEGEGGEGRAEGSTPARSRAKSAMGWGDDDDVDRGARRRASDVGRAHSSIGFHQHLSAARSSVRAAAANSHGTSHAGSSAGLNPLFLPAISGRLMDRKARIRFLGGSDVTSLPTAGSSLISKASLLPPASAQATAAKKSKGGKAKKKKKKK